MKDKDTVDRHTPYEALPEYLAIDEFIRLVPLGKTTTYKLIQAGEIASVRFGHRLFIPKTALRR